MIKTQHSRSIYTVVCPQCGFEEWHTRQKRNSEWLFRHRAPRFKAQNRKVAGSPHARQLPTH